MTILILVSNLTNGGAERVASLWANGFATIGHNVSVCTCRRSSIQDSYSLDSKVQRYDIYNFALKVFSHFGIHYPSALVLRKIIKKIKPDVYPCFKVICPTAGITLLYYLNSEQTITRMIITTLLSVVSIIICVIYLGMNVNERQVLLSKIKKYHVKN